MTSPSRFAPGGIRYCYDETSDTTPMLSRAQGLSGLLRLTAAVEAAGCPMPAQFVQLRERFLEFSNAAAGHAPTMMDRLTEALVSGTGDPHLWFACAMAQTGAGHIERRAEVLSSVHDTMADTLRSLYQPSARVHYAALAARFDRAADRFTRCAAIVDPGADAGEVVNSGDRAVAAWREALAVAGELDALLEPLSCAAELVRGVDQPSGVSISRDPFLLALCADVEGIHRRIAWHAWRDWAEPEPAITTALTIESMTAPRPDTVQHTRGGRWTRLVRCGADIRAYPDPALMALFGRPQNIGVASVPQRNRALLTPVDPEGPLPTEAPKRRRLRDLFKPRTPDQPEPDILDTFLSDPDDESD